jgi:hypothetical protein
MPVTLSLSRAQAIISAAAFLVILGAFFVQTARIEGFKVWPISVTGLKQELADAKAELKRISTAKNEQRETTKETIGKARIIYRDAERQAERIEASPPNGKCETPASIMGADL